MSTDPLAPNRTIHNIRVASGIVFGVGAVVLVIYALLYSNLLMIGLAAFAVLAAGWVLYCFARYRQARRDELMQALATAMELRLPLAPVLRAYVQDRPHSGLYRFLVAATQHVFVFPGYYWSWHLGRSFDERVTALAERLEDGQPLSQGLRALPALANTEARVAAAIGEATGRLAPTMRRVRSDGPLAAWLEVAPRLLYPWLLLLSLACMVIFTMTYTMPKLKKIAEDFKRPLPNMTLHLIDVCVFLADHVVLIFAVVFALLPLTGGVFASSTVRWYVPVVGMVYRWEVRGLVLRLLSFFVDAERPMPDALLLLANDDQLPRVARRRLGRAALLVQQGQPLSDALRRTGLLPKSMAPLVTISQQTGNLPWALQEIGDLLTDRSRHWVRRVSLLVSPVVLVGIAVLVGFVIIAMMMPLIEMLEWLS